MLNYKRSLMLLIFALSCIVIIESQVVCSLDELIRELYEDIIDNGKLDCLRVSVSPNEADETEEQRKIQEREDYYHQW